MIQFLNALGAGDGQGNVSHTRIINIAVTLCWLTSKFYNAHLNHQPITWDNSDLEILGVIGGISIGKSVAENSSSPKPQQSNNQPKI